MRMFTGKQLGPPKLPQIESEFYLTGRGGTVGDTTVQLLPDPDVHPAIIQDKSYVIDLEWWGWVNDSPVGVGYANKNLLIALWDGAAWRADQNNHSADVESASSGGTLLMPMATATGPQRVELTYGGDPGKTLTNSYIWRARVTLYDATGIPLLP